MTQLAVVRSSNGDVYINYHTGEVRHIDLWKGGSLPEITKFELPEDKCSEYDIIDLDCWLENGRYIRAFGSIFSKMPLAPEGDNIVGPFYIKVLKRGDIRFVESIPKGKHIVEYLERIDYYGQDKMHYLTLMSARHEPLCKCDFRSVCGYDRGVKINVLLRRMWYGKKRVCSTRS